MKHLATLAVLTLLLAGCAITANRVSNVHLGMTEAEVLKALGKPVATAETREGKTLYYTFREDWRDQVHSGYSVKLVNGRVESYGRDGAPATSQSTVVPVIVPH